VNPNPTGLGAYPLRTPLGRERRDVPRREAGALREVVVVDAGTVGLDVGPRGAGGAAVELDSTVHVPSPPVSRRQLALK